MVKEETSKTIEKQEESEKESKMVYTRDTLDMPMSEDEIDFLVKAAKASWS